MSNHIHYLLELPELQELPKIKFRFKLYALCIMSNHIHYLLELPELQELPKIKLRFKLYALCIMSNHIHYLLEPPELQELPKIMHWLNWYTAMCFNQLRGSDRKFNLIHHLS